MPIRRDLFAVKELDRTQCNGWCVMRITRDRESASRAAADIRMNQTLGIIRRAKVVHPSQFVVDAFLACGNTIG